MIKYIAVNFDSGKPKKIPATAKLSSIFVSEEGVDRNIKWVIREYYQVRYRYDEGTKNIGSRVVQIWECSCNVFFTKKSLMYYLDNNLKNYGPKELKNIQVVRAFGFFNSFLTEMAVRSVLYYNHGFSIYSGFPFVSQPVSVSTQKTKKK